MRWTIYFFWVVYDGLNHIIFFWAVYDGLNHIK